MTDDSTKAPEQPVLTGGAFLYRQPELLTRDHHGSLGVTPPEHPFEFVSNVRAIPLTFNEFSTAQRHYPIVFSSLEDPVPLAVVAVLDDRNLFVDEQGEWDPLCYVPSYLRCYPFAFARDDKGRTAMVIDRAAPAVTENPRYPFFTDGEISEEITQMIRFCSQFEAERAHTQQLCQRLKDLDLLTTQQATYTPQGESEARPLASYVCVDAGKLTDLDKDTVYEWHRSGELASLYSHLYSLDNWRTLVARRQLK
ncbi:MAG: SapC family protein [Gammaproteobacteria bacterium]